jgi:hypothetical protein
MFRPARARQLKEFMEYYGIDYSGGGNWERGRIDSSKIYSKWVSLPQVEIYSKK